MELSLILIKCIGKETSQISLLICINVQKTFESKAYVL